MDDVAVISTLGAPAVGEAMLALEAGKHVVLLSRGLSLEDEIKLKGAAEEKGLLVMGPESGTTIFEGVGFGFANAVRKGPISIVGTLGTGIQEISCLVDEVGVSHAICVGNRDLSQRVNGLGMLSALKFLEVDMATKVIVLIGKFPPMSVARRVLDATKRSRKPVVLCLLGGPARIISKADIPAFTLEDAATKALALARKRKPRVLTFTLPREVKKIAEREYSRFSYGQKYIRGLFSGGGLCHEAMLILQGLVGDVYSNVPLKSRLRLPDPRSSKRHTCVDFEAEEFARGGLHPIVDLKPRCDRILREARDWEVAVVVLDVVLGQGAHPDPAGKLAKAVEEAKRLTDREGGYLSVVASITGAPRDPQGLVAQREELEKAGVVVMPSNAQAARIAALVATKGKVWKKLKR